MKKLILIISTLIIVSCNSSIHETEYEVKFINGTSMTVVGYSISNHKGFYEVHSIHNNSIFNKEQIVGIYPKEIGYIWNPIIKNEK